MVLVQFSLAVNRVVLVYALRYKQCALRYVEAIALLAQNTQRYLTASDRSSLTLSIFKIILANNGL